MAAVTSKTCAEISCFFVIKETEAALKGCVYRLFSSATEPMLLIFSHVTFVL